jgi:hypothetical protein
MPIFRALLKRGVIGCIEVRGKTALVIPVIDGTL